VESSFRIEALAAVIGGCVFSLILSWLFMEHSLLTEKLVRRGETVIEDYSFNLFQRVFVKAAMKREVSIAHSNTRISTFLEMLSHMDDDNQSVYPVIDDRESIIGTVTKKELSKADGQLTIATIVRDKSSKARQLPIHSSGFIPSPALPVLYPENTLQQAMNHMVVYGQDPIFVVSMHYPHRVEGMLTKELVSSYYGKMLSNVENTEQNILIRFKWKPFHFHHQQDAVSDESNVNTV